MASMIYIRFPLLQRDVEDLLHEHGIDASRETVRFWWNRLGPMFTVTIRRGRRQQMQVRAFGGSKVNRRPSYREGLIQTVQNSTLRQSKSGRIKNMQPV